MVGGDEVSDERMAAQMLIFELWGYFPSFLRHPCMDWA